MIILGGMEESEKELAHLLKNPFPDIYDYTLYYTRGDGEDTIELTFEWLQLKDMEAVKEMGMILLRRCDWNILEDVEDFRFLKYEERKIKGYIEHITVPVNYN